MTFALRSAAVLLLFAAAAAESPAQEDCWRCDLLYGSTGGTEGELFEFDPETGLLRVIGNVPSYSDLALTPDGRLFGLGVGGLLHEIDTCTAASTPTGLVTGRPGATGTTRLGELLTSGLLLQHVDLVAGLVSDLPSAGWCGFAAGDLALNPCDGLAWQVSRGAACPCPGAHTLLQVLDPTTGDWLEDVSCLPFPAVFGLAFDSACRLWLVDADSGALIRVETTDGSWELVPAPDLSGTLGLASVPCDIEGTCAAGGPYFGACGSTVELDAEGTALPSAEPLSYEWSVDCGGGGAFASASGATVELAVPGGCREVCDVELVVSNAEGRGLSCRTTLSLLDDTAPILEGLPADAAVDCDAIPPPAAVSAWDGCDPAPTLLFDEIAIPGRCPGEQELQRTWTATDACGNETSATQVLLVRDREAPIVEPREDLLACLWPPNHRLVRLEAALFAPSIHEDCSEPVSWRLAGCFSDEPDDGLGDGRTRDDCRLSPDGTALLVRAERLGNEDGRSYSALVVATDACGNESAPALAGRVRVAHDRREHLDCLRSAPRR